MTSLETEFTASPVIVLGMHRSGTSYLASVAGACGMHLGAKLLEAAPDNPRGYFEDEEFVHFHSAVLERQLPPRFPASGWDNFYATDDWRPDLMESERDAARALVRRSARGDLWGWKDPRTCLFLDFWLQELPQARLLAIYRHPLEVYGSLFRRQGSALLMDEPAVIDAWTCYNRAILAAWDRHGGPKAMLGTGRVFEQPNEMARIVAKGLGVAAPTSVENWPRFHRGEFERWPISTEAHECFRAAFPAAAATFDELQKRSDAALEIVAGDPLPWGELAMSAPRLGAAARSTLLPIIAGQLSPAYNAARAQALSTGAQEMRRQSIEAPIHARNAEELTAWRACALATQIPSGRSVCLWGRNTLAEGVAAILARRRIASVSLAGGIDAERNAGLAHLAEARRAGQRPLIVVCSQRARDAIIATLAAAGFSGPDWVVALPENMAEADAFFHAELSGRFSNTVST